MVSLLLAIASFQLKDMDTALVHIRHALFREGYYLDKGVVSEALALSVLLESEGGNYKEALCAFQTLQKRDPAKASEQEVATLATDLIKLVDDPAPTLIPGRVMPAPAEGTVPTWRHAMLRERFAFSKVPAEQLTFRVVCPFTLIEDIVVKSKTWSLPPRAGSCEIKVTGPVGATFEFAEIR